MDWEKKPTNSRFENKSVRATRLDNDDPSPMAVIDPADEGETGRGLIENTI